jgi:hypothetical protein
VLRQKDNYTFTIHYCKTLRFTMRERCENFTKLCGWFLLLSREMPRWMGSTTHLTDGKSLSVMTSSVFLSCLISLYYIVQMSLNFTEKLLKSWLICLPFLLKTCMVFLTPSRQMLTLYIKLGQDFCIPQPFNTLITKQSSQNTMQSACLKL